MDKLPRTKKQIDDFIRKLRKPPYIGAVRGDRREFPAERDVMQQLMVEMQLPLSPITTNEDGEVSSRALTDWYVGRFVRANHLTGG